MHNRAWVDQHLGPWSQLSKLCPNANEILACLTNMQKHLSRPLKPHLLTKHGNKMWFCHVETVKQTYMTENMLVFALFSLCMCDKSCFWSRWAQKVLSQNWNYTCHPEHWCIWHFGTPEVFYPNSLRFLVLAALSNIMQQIQQLGMEQSQIYG